jgi:acetyl-CoA carboxylase carboxyltransferase component
MSVEDKREELRRRTGKAKAMGSPRILSNMAAAGLLNARERVDGLLDPGSFHEVGQLAVADRPEMRDRTPADGVVGGFGTIDGRRVGVCASDFSVLGASSAAIAGKKHGYVKKAAQRSGFPLIELGECSGSRIPDAMGARGMAETIVGFAGGSYQKGRVVPWVSAILGQSFGGSTWQAMVSDFVVMRKGAIMGVASPRVTEVAISEPVDPEELGGWRVHAQQTGMIDAVAETDQQALDIIRRFLGYLPSNNGEPAPDAPIPEGSGEDQERLLALVPGQRNRVYDIRKAIEVIVDRGSWFPIKDSFAKVAVTGFARMGGRSVGIVASNPMFKGGAFDAEACDKILPFIVLCDSFNVPLVFLADTPGFFIGRAGEKEKLGAKIMNWILALDQVTVPTVTVILRKAFGMAMHNMFVGRASETACWPGAEISFMDPATAVNVVHGVKYEDEPEKFGAMLEAVSGETSAFDFAEAFAAQAVIDPLETRDFIIRALAAHARPGGVGEHRLANWPVKF